MIIKKKTPQKKKEFNQSSNNKTTCFKKREGSIKDACSERERTSKMKQKSMFKNFV